MAPPSKLLIDIAERTARIEQKVDDLNKHYREHCEVTEELRKEVSINSGFRIKILAILAFLMFVSGSVAAYHFLIWKA